MEVEQSERFPDIVMGKELNDSYQPAAADGHEVPGHK